MGRPTSPTIQELDEMVDHIAYDVQMLHNVCAVAPEAKRMGLTWNNAVLESCTIHARNLLGFYFAPPAQERRKGDVFAFDYLSGDEERWLEVCPEDRATDLFGRPAQEIKQVISTRIGHIALDRRNKMVWHLGPLTAGLLAITQSFYNELAPATRRAFERTVRFDDRI